MPTLRIVALRLKRGSNWQDEYPLDFAVLIIHAPSERRKTSLLEAIAFGLGHDVSFRGVMHKDRCEVEVTIRIGGARHVLRRETGRRRGRVRVTDAAGDTAEFRVARYKDAPVLSDWLLGKLGLQDALASVSGPDGRSPRFATAILPYTYLRQDDLDRFLVMDPSKAAMRTAVLKLLFGLTTPQVQRANGVIKDGEKQLRRLGETLRTVEKVFADSAFPDLASLDEQIAPLQCRPREPALRRRGAQLFRGLHR